MSSISECNGCNLLFILLVFAGLIYFMIRRRFMFWKNKGVYSPEIGVHFRNAKNILMRDKQFGMHFSDLYAEYKKQPYIGVFLALKPTLVVNDLDLIKNILTKDFIHFSDHIFDFDEKVEPLSGHLFNVRGEKWKNLRIKLTPTFTSSKMRQMFDTLVVCAVEMSDYLEEEVKKNDIHEIKDVLAKFGNDVIASCAFGIECNSFKNPDDKFRMMGKRIFKPKFSQILKRSINLIFPRFLQKLNIKTIGGDVEEFFLKVVEETVNYREKNNIVRNDFMQLLIQLKNHGSVSENNEDKKESFPDDGTRLTMIQLAAQVFVFFIAGFETSSTTGSFALYELALNPDIQDTLRKEIDDVLRKHDGKISYDSLKDMTYLTNVIDETLRKHPPLAILFRRCTKDYTIPETNVKIEKDTNVIIPIYGIQRDPDIYENPDKFDPERFNTENRSTRHHFSHLPFGEGPRICIGNRFGLMQTKLGLVTFLSKYEVSVCDKTIIPMDYDKRSFLLTTKGGLFLRIKKRSH